MNTLLKYYLFVYKKKIKSYKLKGPSKSIR